MPTDDIAHEVVLKCHYSSNGVYINSDDVPGLHICGDSVEDMKPVIETAIKTLFLDNRKVDVGIAWLSDFDVFPHPSTFSNKLAIFHSAA